MIREYVLKDVVNGSTSTTKSWGISMDHITVCNDDQSYDLSVEVGDMTIIAKPLETIEAMTEPFSSINIVASAPFRIFVRDLRIV
jgi:hypothetical protein